MNIRVYSVEVCSDCFIEVTFFDGSVKQFDINRLSAYEEKYLELLNNKSLFKDVKVTENNCGVRWGDGTDYLIDNETLYYEGILVETRNVGNPKVQLAAKLTQIREALGLTQKDLEKRTGIHQSDISKIERGVANPSLETLNRLADAMGCSVTHDFYIKNENDNHEVVRGNLARGLSVWKPQGAYTVDDILSLPEGTRAELIDGVIYDMAPPLVVHQRIILEFAYAIKSFIKDSKGECEVLISPIGVLVSTDDKKNYLEPDLVVVCNSDKIEKRFITGGPDFVLEVTSDTTSSRDFTLKKQKYQEAGVREYWILDVKRERVIIYLQDNNFDTPMIHTLGEEVGIHIYDSNLKIDLNEISKLIDKD